MDLKVSLSELGFEREPIYEAVFLRFDETICLLLIVFSIVWTGKNKLTKDNDWSQRVALRVDDAETGGLLLGKLPSGAEGSFSWGHRRAGGPKYFG